MVFMPTPSAHPSSRSMVGRSNVSACHISNSLMAVLGMKLLPTRNGWRVYQSFACGAGQRCAVAANGVARLNHNHPAPMTLLRINFLRFTAIHPIELQRKNELALQTSLVLL